MDDRNETVKLLISQAETLRAEIRSVINDGSTEQYCRYVSHRNYAKSYNNIAQAAERVLGLHNFFNIYYTDTMKNQFDTPWLTQKEVVEAVILDIGTLLNCLKSALPDSEPAQKMNNQKVFIVHGHDEKLLQEIELLIRRIGLQPIIIKNESSSGRTIIEQIEHYTDVGFGIVLYTCCDEGRAKGDASFQDRARQNVIFEHGFLCAKLSRNRVVALIDAGIEVPSDLAGVVYISHNDPNWRNQIMREMKEAGMEFDSTKA